MLCGCQLEPPYDPIEVETPLKWKYQEKDITTPPLICMDWWEIFKDPILHELEQEAIARNPDLQAAMERVSEARNIVGIVRADLYPHINLDPYHYNRGVLIEQYSVTGNHFLRAHQRDYAIPLLFKYEVDLWDQYWNEYKSAYLNAEAQAWNYETSLLILTTDLASAYFQMRIQDTLIDLLKATLATRHKTLSINQARFKTRVGNFSPVALSELDLHQVEALYENAMRARRLFENQIAILIGQPPAEFSLAHAPIYDSPPEIPSGLPSDIIKKRPDIREQEMIMASIHAQIGVAYASYFPSIELIASAGFISPNFRDFLTLWSRLWMYGVNVTQYIFDAGARFYRVELTWAQYRETVAIYKKRVLDAFGEVENALSNLQQLSKEREAIKKAIDAAKKAYIIDLHRYLKETESYLAVADDERQVLDNQRLYVELLGLSYINTVQLIKALGGGWN
jgi:multidrug efflux system outer membrane protein